MEVAMLTDGVSVTDESLAVAARNGDRAAYSALVQRYRNPVFATSFAMLGNREDAEDAAQESFVRAYRALNSFDARRPWSAWLMSIVRNLCRDMARRRSVRIAQPLGETLHADTAISPEADLLVSEGAEEIRSAVAALPEQVRVPIVLHYAYGHTNREIALALGLPESTVVGRIASGLRRLRRRFAGEVQ
ncbi:MAG: sigma-70 family RNA polymerase sigma factor [Armatimonadetes bacterium]|nr:sigma-70 family RNA polymerase sigma factor [Armatimonadota bacterium]